MHEYDNKYRVRRTAVRGGLVAGPTASGRGTEFPKSIPGLNGVTIGEMWDWLYKGDSLFPIVREELRKRYPDIKFVEYPVIGNIHGPDENEIVAGLLQLL